MSAFLSVHIYTHMWGLVYECVCVHVYAYVFVCLCACVILTYSICLFPSAPPRQEEGWSTDKVRASHESLCCFFTPTSLRYRHEEPTMLGNLGCLCRIGNRLQSESHQLRKQLSHWEKKISITAYLAHGEKAANCLVTSFSFQLVVMTLTGG